MPSGYTAAIYDGKDVSLRDFLMGVGRGMGYSIMQRDDDASAPVRRSDAQTKYHDERIAAAKREIDEARGWSEEDAARHAVAAYEDAQRRWDETRDVTRERRQRYEAMIAEVEAWQPDPLIQSTKDVALEQLRSSLEFDCGKTPDDDMRWYPKPQLRDGAVYRQEVIQKAEDDIAYHTRERAAEVARAEERNRYIDAFHASLPEPVVAA